MSRKILRLLPLMAIMAVLTGCKLSVLNPSGDVAMQQRDLIVASTVLMLIIVVPVLLLIFYFAWRYRASNTKAKYDPEWYHSTGLEVLIWTAPLVIIVALGALTWVSTHLLDPYRPLARIDAARPVPEGMAPIEVDVVALDWKWLFIYPQQGFATVNELAVPVDVPIQFRLSASSVMNTLSVPEMAGMIYAMPGMVTKLHAVMNKPGDYHGFSGHYSGAGFSDMRFTMRAMPQADFDRWVAETRAGQGGNLGREEYLALAKPSIKDAPRRFASVDPGLFGAIADQCVEPGRMCMSEMARLDAQGGIGPVAAINTATRRVHAGGVARREGVGHESDRTYVLDFCTPSRPTGLLTETSETGPVLALAPAPLTGTAE